MQTPDKNSVSILIPCYNAEDWIEQAIESSLQQSWPHCEVIVVDDGSSDHSLEKIKQFGDKIRWETGPNRGGNWTRNRLLELSTGTWLQYLDADDYLQPDKVENQIKTLNRHPDTDILFGPVIMRYEEPEPRMETEELPEPQDPWSLLALWKFPQTGSPLWRKEAVRDVGAWDESYPCCQEHELYSRLLMQAKVFRYSEDSGAVYRQWSEQTVCKKNFVKVHQYQTEIRNKIEEHLRETKQLTDERQRAINQGHFETARMLWLYNSQKARKIMGRIQKTFPHFIPTGDAAPPNYQKIYATFGFTPAEIIASIKRKILGS